MNTFHKELIRHPIILSSIGVVVVIAIGSALYYMNSTRVPAVPSLSDAATNTLEVTGSGIVEPAENPDLAFASGGRVASVRVNVGDTVYQGELLASLDTSALSAQRAQAQANVAAAEARLAEMLAGARQEDISAKQTAVDQASTALINLYTSTATNIVQSYDKAFSGFAQNTDTLFNQPNSGNPTLLFPINNSQLAGSVATSRVTAQGELGTWQTETGSLSSGSSREQVDASLTASLNHLQVLRTYSDQLLTALSNAIPTTNFPQSSISAAQVSVGSYRDSINTLTNTLQSAQQQIALSKLGVQAANNALSQVTAHSTPEQIAAQQATIAAARASVDSINAQIRNEIITAPFSGTVASVHIKTGDIVAANTPAISLNPESALQITAYFSEIDVTKIHVGDTAEVTLDAYGSGRTFQSHIVSVDSAPSKIGGGSTGYKATFQFEKSDPAVTSGMNANIIISLRK